jgi:hypothetical protein
MLELKRAAALLATLTLVPLAGCGHTTRPAATTATTAPGVATLRSDAPTAAASTGAPALDDLRPLIRPDMTGAEVAALYTAWGKCLLDRGAPAEAASGPKVNTDLLKQPKYKSMVAACAAKQPEMWQDREARTDPAYDDHFRAEITCIRGHGVKVSTGGDGRQIIVTDDSQAAGAAGVIQACEQQAFGAAIKSFNAH